MTSKEAIDEIEYIREAIRKGFVYNADDEDIEWIEVALKALKQNDAKGCNGCKYISEFDYCFRCKVCSRSYIDRWEGGSDES